MIKIIRSITSLFLVFALSQAVFASDFAKEQRWVEQVADFIIDGDVEMLAVGDREIFSLYTEADENPKNRAIIVVHGLGVHPDWAQVVQPVRVEMTQYGWHTLSIQMPVLANGIGEDDYKPLFKQVAPRIEAAIKFLHGNDMQEIVLVAHSLGSAMSAHYFANNPNSAISKFVAVGLGDAKSVSDIHIPMLDLYGSEDLPNVLKTADARKNSAKQAKNMAYKQVVIKDAGHFFNDKNTQMLNEINKFLK